MESLEKRVCLSSLYGLEVLAQTGSQLSQIEDFVSVNHQLKASFVATDAAGRSGVYVGSPRVGSLQNDPILVSFPESSELDRLYGRAASISGGADASTPFVAARDQVIGSSNGSLVRRWPADGNVAQLIDVAASKHIFHLPEPESFDGLLSLTDINDHGQVVFVGLDTSGGNVIHKLRVRESLVGASAGVSLEIGDFPASAGLRPQISNTTEVVFRSPSGQSIFKTDRLSDRFRRIAGTQEGFAAAGDLPAVGRSPGISDDGRVVVFFGNHPEDNEPEDGLGGGPGIFASILKPGGDPNGGAGERMLVRLAGIPGELQNALGHPIALEQYATSSSVSGLNTTDSRVGVGGTLEHKLNSDSVLYATFLANDPLQGNCETIWRVTFTTSIDDQGVMKVSVGKLDAVLRVGDDVVDRYSLPFGKVTDLELYDPITNQGDIGFWMKLDTGGQAVVVASRPRNPVLVVPGIVGTFAKNDYLHWLMNRGEHPDNLQIDPLGGYYNDIIATLKKAGYVEGHDLFVANYDWRVLPGPIDDFNLSEVAADWRFDGQIEGLEAHVNRSEFEYGVDYFMYWLKKAVDVWHDDHPEIPLESVDVIAHSTGGLVTRTYIQSDAYQGEYAASFGAVKLPKIDKFVMVGVPNRGAAKAWNPLHDNFIDDFAFRRILSKVIKGAFEKQGTQPISGPDGVITAETDERTFIERYIPTIRSLLATYDFLGTLQSPPMHVNFSPRLRNNLLLDLNAGLDLGGSSDSNSFASNRFADLVGTVVNIYGTNEEDTPVAMALRAGPDISSVLADIHSFRDKALGRKADFDEEWYSPITCPACGDGTVPLESSQGQFLGDPRIEQPERRIKLLPFTRLVNTKSAVGHTALLSNPDVQAAILRELSRPIPRSDISTDAATTKIRTAISIFLDPVEGFVIDGQGRRLGYTSETGALTEIPNSVYFGDRDGIGWIMGSIVPPLTLQLTGLGADHFVELAGVAGVTAFGVESRGYLAPGETRSLPVIQAVNYPPLAVVDVAEATHGSTTIIDVLANDSDPDGDSIVLTALDTTRTRGVAEITVDGKIAYTPAERFEGVDTLSYTIGDGKEGLASAELSISVPGRPRILAIHPSESSEIGSLGTMTVSFSHALDPLSATQLENYQVFHETQGFLPIAAVAYRDEDDLHQVAITLDSDAITSPGRVQLRLDGRALRTVTGQTLSGGRDELLIVFPLDNQVSQVGQHAEDAYTVSSSATAAGFDAPSNLAIGDLNLDGIADLVAVSGSTSELVVYFGEQSGGYEEPITIRLPEPVPGRLASPTQAIIADWDLDGFPDLITYTHFNDYWLGTMNHVHVYLGNGQGGFERAPETPIDVGSSNMGGILSVGDFTGDGLPDVAVAEGGIYGKDPYLGYTLRAELSGGPDGWYLSSAVTADFNSDGRPDLAVATTGYYLLNPGTLVFLSTPTGLAPAVTLQYEYLNGGQLAAADFTGDGNTDLAIVHDYYRNSYGIQDGQVISLLAGDGQGNFTEHPHQVLNARNLGLIGAEDMNGNGTLDLVFTASVYPHNHAGGFPGLDHASSWIFQGDGQGGFQPATPVPVPIMPHTTVSPSFVSLADMNRDGFADVVMGNAASSTITGLLNDRQGRLYAAPHVLDANFLWSAYPDPVRRVLADANSDGLTDLLLLVGAHDSKQLAVYLRTPDDRLSLHATIPVPGVTDAWSATGWLQAGDLNGDGIVDAIVGSHANGVTVLLGSGDGGFTPVGTPPFAVTDVGGLDTYYRGTVADVNGDGNPDLMVTISNWDNAVGTSATGWAVYFGDGTGRLYFNRHTYLPFPAGLGLPTAYDLRPATSPDYSPVIRDFDFDGKVDFLVTTTPAGEQTARVTVYRGNGNGTFAPGKITVQPFPLSLLGYIPGDFNSDGNLDVLGYSAGSIELLLGDGTGHYLVLPGATQSLLDFGSGFYFSTVEVGDFDGDGTLDVALARANGASLSLAEEVRVVGLFLNDGTGHFSDGRLVPLESTPGSLQTVQDNRWVEAQAWVMAPTLWPAKLRDGDVIFANQQVVSGLGPPGARVAISRAGQQLGQAVIQADGSWTLSIQPLLPQGYHLIELATRDDAGQFASVAEYTVLIAAPQMPWQNARNPLDVNDNSFISPLDALLVINELNRSGSHSLPDIRPSNEFYYDVSGDTFITPRDALLVINHLNQSRDGEGELTPAAGGGSGRGLAMSPDYLPLGSLETAVEMRNEDSRRHHVPPARPRPSRAPAAVPWSESAVDVLSFAVREPDSPSIGPSRNASRRPAAPRSAVIKVLADLWQHDVDWLDLNWGRK